MADRYQDRPFSTDDNLDRGGDHGRGESDPLAELARLIGQTDPFGPMGRANHKVQPRPVPEPRAPYRPPPPPAEVDDGPPPGPPAWMQRAGRQEVKPPPTYEEEPEADYQPSPVHPLHRYAAQHQQPHDDYRQQAYDEPEGEVDPSRYDDALFGQIESGAQNYQREPAYPDDPYAYQGSYADEGEERSEKRRGG